MKTRVGKIARLPKIIRDQINQKIEDCVPAKNVLVWLNDLPEVQKIMAEQFGGRPISKQNISEWRHGGYRDWASSREGRKQWWEYMETAQKLTQHRDNHGGDDINRHLATFLVVELAEALDELHDMKNSSERRQLLRTISIVLSRLQTDAARDKRLLLKHCQELGLTAKSRAVQPSQTPEKKFASLTPEHLVAADVRRL